MVVLMMYTVFDKSCSSHKTKRININVIHGTIHAGKQKSLAMTTHIFSEMSHTNIRRDRTFPLYREAKKKKKVSLKMNKSTIYYCLPVNHPNNPKSDWNDSTQKDLQSICPCIHQVQLADDQQCSTTSQTQKQRDLWLHFLRTVKRPPNLFFLLGEDWGQRGNIWAQIQLS